MIEVVLQEVTLTEIVFLEVTIIEVVLLKVYTNGGSYNDRSCPSRSYTNGGSPARSYNDRRYHARDKMIQVIHPDRC